MGLTGLPDWCSATADATSQWCIQCNRPAKSGNAVTFPSQCFKAPGNFNSKKDCGLLGDGPALKSVSCRTSGSDLFAMDVSFASEKAAGSIPLLLLAVSTIADKHLAGQPDAKATVQEILLFISSKMPALLAEGKTDSIAADFIVLANKHLKTPMTDAQKNIALKDAGLAFDLIKADLESHQQFSIVRTAGMLLGVAKTVPGLNDGPAKSYFEGASLATLVDGHRTEVDRVFSILKPEILGVKSTDDLIAQLKSLK